VSDRRRSWRAEEVPVEGRTKRNSAQFNENAPDMVKALEQSALTATEVQNQLAEAEDPLANTLELYSTPLAAQSVDNVAEKENRNAKRRSLVRPGQRRPARQSRLATEVVTADEIAREAEDEDKPLVDKYRAKSVEPEEEEQPSQMDRRVSTYSSFVDNYMFDDDEEEEQVQQKVEAPAKPKKERVVSFMASEFEEADEDVVAYEYEEEEAEY
jgi:hypothetical protein